MILTQKLLGFLNRVFDKDPKAFTALRFRYAGAGMTWRVQDKVLTTTVVGGTGANLTVDLSAHTIQSLINHLAAQTGYTVTYVDASRVSLSASVLLDSAGNQAESNGDRLTGYTSLLWAWMESASDQLVMLKAQVTNMLLQLNVNTGEGMWLDEIGGYYNVPRLEGEADQFYGPRIIDETLRPRGNNVAIENAIETYTRQDSQVVDVTVYGGNYPLYDNTITHNAAQNHSAGDNPLYGLFDVAYYSYDLVSGAPIESFQATIEGIIDRMRDAGTHMRALALSGSLIQDTLTPPTETLLMEVALPLADTLTAPTDTFGTVVGHVSLGDELVDPDDDKDGLLVFGRYRYDGFRDHDGLITYSGGLITDQSIDGLTVNSETPIGDLFWLKTDMGAPIIATNLLGAPRENMEIND